MKPVLPDPQLTAMKKTTLPLPQALWLLQSVAMALCFPRKKISLNCSHSTSNHLSPGQQAPLWEQGQTEARLGCQLMGQSPGPQQQCPWPGPRRAVTRWGYSSWGCPITRALEQEPQLKAAPPGRGIGPGWPHSADWEPCLKSPKEGGQPFPVPTPAWAKVPAARAPGWGVCSGSL